MNNFGIANTDLNLSSHLGEIIILGSRSNSESSSQIRIKMGFFFILKSVFGYASPDRVPWPAAATTQRITGAELEIIIFCNLARKTSIN